MPRRNQEKGDRTIYEWAGEDKVQEIVDSRHANIQRGKIRNIETEHVPDDAIPESLLHDGLY